jgi:glycosyltransferase involved in cell wall biosynthesis
MDIAMQDEQSDALVKSHVAGRSVAGASYRVLLVVRHPVGGIRTFFDYVYRNFDSGRFRFALLAPELPETRILLQDLKSLGIEYLPSDPQVSAAALTRRVVAVLRTEHFDLLHSHGFTSTVCATPGALLRGVPHVASCHDVFTQKQFEGIRGWAGKAVLTAALLTTRRVHCVTHSARDNLLQYLRGLRPRASLLSVIPNGIDTSRFRCAERRDLRAELGLREDSFLIGFFGRFMSQKGFRYLIDALELLRSDHRLPKRPFVISFGVADGYYREEQARVARKGLSESVYFLPFVPNIAASLKGLDVVAMPSLWEACGLLAMEALVAGVPLVGTDCVGLSEVLADTPAAVVPPADGAALYEAIKREMISPTVATARAFAASAAARYEVRDRALALEQLLLGVLHSG